jgi:hypothetical protein
MIRKSPVMSRFVVMAATDRNQVTFAKVKTSRGIEGIEAFWDINSTVESVAEDLLQQAKDRAGE